MNNCLPYFRVLTLSLVVFFSIVYTDVIAQVTTTDNLPGTKTYTVPSAPGFYNLTIQVWAGGGGGGLGGPGVQSGGGGGGGYATANLLNVPAGTTFSYTVGSGGVAGGDGTSSFFDTNTPRAEGGKAGTNSNGGAGGTPTNGTGWSGGAGANPVPGNGSNGAGGGGGGSAFINQNGNPGVFSVGGTGFGNGGNGGQNNSNAQDGLPPGGGGGGRGNGQANGNYNKVGVGANGQVVITATCATVAGGTASTTTNPVCIGSSASLSLTGHVGSIQWQKRLLPSGNFENITGATNANLTDIPNSAGTWEYRAVVNNACSGTSFSTVVSITVNPLSNAGTLSGGIGSICFPSSTSDMTVSGYFGTIQWQRRKNNGSWVFIVGASNPNYSEVISTANGFTSPPANSFDTYQYRVVVTNGACSSTSPSSISIQVYAAGIAGSVSGPNSQLCFGSNTGTLSATSSGGAIQWKRQINNGTIQNVGTGLNTFSETINLANGFSQPIGTADIYHYWVVVTNGACVTTSSIKSIQVDASDIGGSIQGANCGGAFYLPASTGTMTLTGYKGNIVKWQRQKNGLGYADTSPLDTDDSHIENFTNEFNNSGNYRYIVLVENGVCPVTASPFCEVDLFYQAPQPVELLNFRAFRKDQSIELNWSTASEANNEGFNIERSNDANNWQPLSFVPGQGTTTEFHAYTYTDISPLTGTNYYRLSQRDFDGKSEYFKLVAVDMTEEFRPFQVYPNPATEQITVMTSDESPNILRIYDLFGRLYIAESIEGTEQVISLAGFAPGVYQVVFSQNGKLQTEKLFVE